jgi:hypothetical protein
MSAIFIPAKLRVGFVNRKDCYTNKLGFVIYYDKTDKIRKEKRLEGWRDKKIDLLECTNEPTSGFVLNKKAGDYSSRWGGRQAYSRVYDPRGFEIEINVDNLLFILENCVSSPGKALGGEFVYAFEGTSLLLLPTNCPDYKEHKSFSELKERRITPKKIKVGYEYLDKSNTKYIAMGKCRWYNSYSWSPCTSGFTFYNTEKKTFDRDKHNFIWESDDPSDLLQGLIEQFSNSKSGSPAVELVELPHKYDQGGYCWRARSIIKKTDRGFEVRYYDTTGKENESYSNISINDGEVIKEQVPLVTWIENKTIPYYWGTRKEIVSDSRSSITPEQYNQISTKLFYKLQNGELIEC